MKTTATQYTAFLVRSQIALVAQDREDHEMVGRFVTEAEALMSSSDLEAFELFCLKATQLEIVVEATKLGLIGLSMRGVKHNPNIVKINASLQEVSDFVNLDPDEIQWAIEDFGRADVEGYAITKSKAEPNRYNIWKVEDDQC